MNLILDTSSTEFQACGPFEPRLDKDGVHRRDKNGGTNLPLYTGKLVAWVESDAETILVAVAAVEPPKAAQRSQSLRSASCSLAGTPKMLSRSRRVVDSRSSARGGAVGGGH
jgi:hypothetical protein